MGDGKWGVRAGEAGASLGSHLHGAVTQSDLSAPHTQPGAPSWPVPGRHPGGTRPQPWGRGPAFAAGPTPVGSGEPATGARGGVSVGAGGASPAGHTASLGLSPGRGRRSLSVRLAATPPPHHRPPRGPNPTAQGEDRGVGAAERGRQPRHPLTRGRPPVFNGRRAVPPVSLGRGLRGDSHQGTDPGPSEVWGSLRPPTRFETQGATAARRAPPTPAPSPGLRWPRCESGPRPWPPRPRPPPAPTAPSPGSRGQPPRPACPTSRPPRPAAARKSRRSP